MLHSRFIRALIAFFLGLTIFAWAVPVQAVQAAGARTIIVSLSKQKLYAYQGNTLVYSTSIVARGTRSGTFRVQNKIPLVRSVVRGWKLPYWMGIYYVGRIQNGIHGPEYTANGKRAVVSLGCVVLRTNADAAWLYRWATVGTTVSIRR